MSTRSRSIVARRPESATRPTLRRERELAALGYRCIAGVDEAGRGPLAGPVVAAAVVLPPDLSTSLRLHLNDSKQLPPAARDTLFKQLIVAADYGIGIVPPAIIDRINIRQASWRAMQEAVADLERRDTEQRDAGKSTQSTQSAATPVDYVLVDGLPYGAGPWPYEAIVKGDARSLSIAAASIIAKVTRDRLMEELDAVFPLYGFARHKGYPSPQHRRALAEHGPCAIHRRTYGPVQRAIEERRALRVSLDSG